MPQVKDSKTRRERPARGTTKAEFVDFLKETVEKIKKLLEGGESRLLWEVAGLSGVEPMFSFDNPRIHGGAERWEELMLACDLEKKQRYPLSPYSPDIHRVIEHTHARLCGDFQRWINSHTGPFDLPAYKSKLFELFYERQTPEVIANDVKTLPALYAAIIKAGGGWPPKPFR